MAFYDLAWYCNAGDQSTTGYYAVTKWAASTAVAAGVLRRQNAVPAVNNERVFICIVAGTTGGTEPSWVLTRGAKTTDNTVTWQECTGMSAVNGDLTNTVNWTAAKAVGTPTLGAIIKRNNGASYQICTTAGTLGASEPAFSDTAGVTTTETAGTTVWTSLGVVGNFTGGQAPHARLVNACANTWFAIGNTVYVADNHAENQTSPNLSITITGSVTVFGRILCHNHSGSYPPAAVDLTTGAVVSTNGGATITINSAGCLYVYGITFKGGIGTSGFSPFVGINSANGWCYFDRCSLQIASTGSNNTIVLGGNGASGSVVLNNTTVYFGHTSQFINVQYSQLLWQNTGQVLASGSSVPANFLNMSTSAAQQNNITLEALDLGQLTGNLFNTAITTWTNVLIKDCKLNATSAIPALTVSSGPNIQLVRCDSAATAYKSARYQYEGTEITETSITRVGGATDPASQAQSRKIVTTANAQWLRPFRAEPYAAWNATTGANVTVTVCGTINSGTLPNNDEIWLEVEYLSSSGSPLGTVVTTTKSNVLAAGSAVASDGSTWNGGGSGAGWSPFKLTTALSSPQPGMAGYVHARVRCAKASTTYYLDPKVTLT